MDSTSPWLDVHRGRQSRPRAENAPESGSDGASASGGDAAEESASENEPTHPWDDVDATQRPSQSNVDLPSPNRSADD